jgi:outer membrane biosynthesis protein TonB
MKSKIAVLFLIVLLCLTSGCSNTSHIAEQPAPVSSSGSNEAPSQAETAQATEKTEVEQPRSTEPKDDDHSAEATVSVSESDTQTTEVPDQADHSTAVLPQPSEPEKKTDESERRPETAAPTEKEQPTPPATEESKPVDQPQPTEPPKQESTEPAFDISYWIGFAKSYAESVGLALNSEAVYCWDNPIDADVGCIYLERDIQSRLNRYAADAEITDVWVWYEPVSTGSYLIYIGYA